MPEPSALELLTRKHREMITQDDGTEPTAMWNGFLWVEVEPKKEKLPRLAKPDPSKGGGKLSEVEWRTHEAKQRLVKLNKEMAAARASRARTEVAESNHRAAQEVRRQLDDLKGKDAERMASFEKVKPLDADEVLQLSEELNAALAHEGASSSEAASSTQQPSRAWVTLWRGELDADGVGRASYDAFTEMLRSRLPHLRGVSALSGKSSQRSRLEAAATLRGLWVALDHDGTARVDDDGKHIAGTGGRKGYLERHEFVGFMKLGQAAVGPAALGPAASEEDGCARNGPPAAGWRERVVEQKKAEAEAMRTARRQRIAADMMSADLESWKREMARVRAATPGALRELSTLLHHRRGHQAGSWYASFKAIDRSGDGKVSWGEFSSAAREWLGPDYEAAAVRSAWRALDVACEGFLSVGDFGAFMRLGAPRVSPPPTLQMLRAQSCRVRSDMELAVSQTVHTRRQRAERDKYQREADLLQQQLDRMRSEGEAKAEGRSGRDDGSTHPSGAQTERSAAERREERSRAYKAILYREDAEEERNYYLGKAEALERRRTLATFRRVQQRYKPSAPYHYSSRRP